MAGSDMKKRKGNTASERQHGINILRKAMSCGLVDCIREVIKAGNKETKSFWGGYSRLFFNEIAPKGFEQEEERKKFDTKLNKLMGNKIHQFWLAAYESYLMFLRESTIKQRKLAEELIREAIDRYQYQKENYEKALKILRKLLKQGFISSIPDKIRENPERAKLLLLRTKAINLFIWYLVESLKRSLKPTQVYRITQDFLTYYLNHDIDLTTIKKICQRNPFRKMITRIKSASNLT
jgi:hypothetical protein